MGLNCTKKSPVKESSSRTSTRASTNPSIKSSKTSAKSQMSKLIYLRNADGEDVSSHQMRGLSDTRPELSDETIEIAKASWDIIKKDIERVGVVMFMGLLEDHVEVRNTFTSFRDMTEEELLASSSLRSHVLRVMGAVDKVVSRLNEPDKLVPLLHDLGQKHIHYNARPEFLDLVGPEFNTAIQPALGDEWTPETEQAWADLFRYITHIMKETMIM